MKKAERAGYLATLTITRRQVEQQATEVRRRIRADNDLLEQLQQRLADIDQSIDYLEGW